MNSRLPLEILKIVIKFPSQRQLPRRGILIIMIFHLHMPVLKLILKLSIQVSGLLVAIKLVVNKARTGRIKPNVGSKEAENFEQRKLIKFIKPTQEELKFILEKIIEEINVEKDS